MIIYIYIIARCRQGQPVKETLMSQSQCHVFMFLQVLKVKQSYLSVGHLGQRNSIRCWAIYYQRWLHIADPISIELIDVRVNFLIWWISRLIGIWCSGPVFSYHIMKYFHAAYKNYYCFTVFFFRWSINSSTLIVRKTWCGSMQWNHQKFVEPELPEARYYVLLPFVMQLNVSR